MTSGIEFWTEEAKAGRVAGTRDTLARDLERITLGEHLTDGMNVLDAGCGDGGTVRYLADWFKSSRFHGIDFVPELVEAARRFIEKPRVTFAVGDLLLPPAGPWDVVITQRAIINLPDWSAQAGAIQGLIGTVRPGGRYLMMENSADGLEHLNRIRAGVDLPPIMPPAHNRYLRSAEVTALSEFLDVPVTCVQYSNTYYFLSRVVNAALAAENGFEPHYLAPINRLALMLPAISEPCGQGRLWIWEKP